jgi:hypothetical protein
MNIPDPKFEGCSLWLFGAVLAELACDAPFHRWCSVYVLFVWPCEADVLASGRVEPITRPIYTPMVFGAMLPCTCSDPC